MSAPMKAEQNPLFLYSTDLIRDGEYATPTLKIEAVTAPGKFQDHIKKKPIERYGLKFERVPQVLILNRTNQTVCSMVLGDSRPSTWIDKLVTLVVCDVNAGQEGIVPAIRIKPTAGIKLPKRVLRHMGKPATLLHHATAGEDDP